MSAQIKYAYLKGHTWLYRRHYPKDVAVVLGAAALKQSLKTGDPSTARVRAAELNAEFERLVSEARRGSQEVTREAAEWGAPSSVTLARLQDALERSGEVQFARKKPEKALTIDQLAEAYLNRRSDELRPGGFKSVRYSVGLFRSKYRDLSIRQVTRDHGLEFLELVAQLSPLIGKSERTHGLTLDQLVHWSSSGAARITPRTQRRIWSQVNHWLDWVVYEGHLASNPFNSVRFSKKVRPAPYAVLTDEEVRRLLSLNEPVLHPVLLFCLLTGMRSGEASGLMRDDLVNKGNLGTFVHVRPNEVRLLKTDAAERLVPVHSALEPVLDGRGGWPWRQGSVKTRPRSRAVIWPHSPSRAVCAAVTAASISAAPPRAIWARGVPSEGLIRGSVSAVADHRPPMSCSFGSNQRGHVMSGAFGILGRG